MPFALLAASLPALLPAGVASADPPREATSRAAGVSADREPPRRPAAGDTITNSIGIKLAYIPPTRPEGFWMGSPAEEAGRGDDETRHKVILTKGFYLGTTPVTQGRWKAVMGYNPSHFKGNDLPVEMVTWDEAVEFCKKLSEKEGKHYRLPTEAEWEYACRAGTTTPFNTGATISTDQANYDGNDTYGEGVKGVYRQKTTPVGTFRPNAWGLYDMHGNVRQWCGDFYGPYPGEETDPRGPRQGDVNGQRVRRGGSWFNIPRNCRSATRDRIAPEFRSLFAGFRVALEVP